MVSRWDQITPERRYEIVVPGDGAIVALLRSAAWFDGDSSLVRPLQDLLMSPVIEGRGHIGSWDTLGAIRLALETIEPRFASDWAEVVPVDIRTAEKPKPTPPGDARDGVCKCL